MRFTVPPSVLAVTEPSPGATLSNVIVAVAAVAVALPAESRKCAYTVFVPAPLASVHDAVVLYVTQLEQVVVFEMHI